MHKNPVILVVKESRHDERRVSLVPEDVDKLIMNGFNVLVEDQAGAEAGFSNHIYESIGAQICKFQHDSVESYRAVFNNVDVIIRVKRPDETREKLECLTVRPGTKMIGSLGLSEKSQAHLKRYAEAGIDYYSFDQFYFSPGTPMDAMKKMGAFAGRLAVLDALQKMKHVTEKVVVIGYGEAGKAACEECLERKLSCTVITSQQHKAALLQLQGVNAVYMDRETPLYIWQEAIKNLIKDADIVIAAASSNGEAAPILVSHNSMMAMKAGSVIVDLAVTEGGNVEGSQPDATLILGNHICVTNVSGYPKAMPVEASMEWSKASYYFINMLMNTPQLLIRRSSFLI